MNEQNKGDALNNIRAYFENMTPEQKRQLDEEANRFRNMTPLQKRTHDLFARRSTVEEYRKIVGLHPSESDPVKEDLARLDMYKYTSASYYELHGTMPVPSFREQEQQRRLARFREFQAFDSLQEILEEWECGNGRIVEAKFVRPSTLAGWQSTVYQCATMVKALKTLHHFMPVNLHKYNFIYQSKTLFKKTTHAFEYDSANFAFVIRTGLGSGGQEVKNVPVNFYEQTQEQLHHLLGIMKQELPQSHYERIFMIYVLIKDKRKAII
jgi:hypothetical protein